MDDVTTRLRALPEKLRRTPVHLDEHIKLLLEAADEIERLRRVIDNKDAAQWKGKERERMRKAGYVLRQIWVKPEDWPKVQRYIKRLVHIAKGNPV
jgi:hypothetical protein